MISNKSASAIFLFSKTCRIVLVPTKKQDNTKYTSILANRNDNRKMIMINDLHQKQLKNIVLTAKVHIKVQGNSHQRNVHVIKTALGINFVLHRVKFIYLKY